MDILLHRSSGSSIFKAIDRQDNSKTVAIKKIPLSVMTDGPGNETTSDDVDYFVSWIADHCCAETKVEDGCASPTEASSSPVVPGYPRRRSSISTDSKGLDQIVQCLGCHRDDDELWVSPKEPFFFIIIVSFFLIKKKKQKVFDLSPARSCFHLIMPCGFFIFFFVSLCFLGRFRSFIS